MLTLKHGLSYASGMKYDINTVEDIAAAFDGPGKAGRMIAGISASAICQWVSSGYVPPSRHIQVWVAAKRVGKTINPELFGLTPEDARLLGMAEEHTA